MTTIRRDGGDDLSNRRGLRQSGGGDNDSLAKQSPVAGSRRHGLRQLFRAAIKATTRRAEDEPPPPRRRKSGETGKAFRCAVPALLRRRSPPAAAVIAATAYLSDTLDWFRLWDDNRIDESSAFEDNHDAQQTHPSLHL
jgi:hypothetical protein